MHRASENLGLSCPLRTLIGNLLNCDQGDLAGDYAYKAMQDVSLDLHRMVQDPVRFLYSIETNPMPSLVLCDKLYGREEEIQTLEILYNSQPLYQCNSNESIVMVLSLRESPVSGGRLLGVVFISNNTPFLITQIHHLR